MPRPRGPLPKWATWVDHASSVGLSPVPIDQEESYLRTRCYHEASRAIDRALDGTLDQSSKTIVKQMEGFDPDRSEKHEPTRKKTRFDGPDQPSDSPEGGAEQERMPNRALFTLKSSQEFHPELLPVHLISAPLNPLDRLARIKHLVATQRRHTKHAVVWIQSGPPSSWVTEVLRQVLILEPLRRTTGLRGLSPIEKLHLWCRSSERFNSIRICLDVQTIGSSTPPVNQFLCWLANARAHHAIPLSVVLFDSSGIRRHDLCAYEQGSCGFAVKRHVLCSNDELLQESLAKPILGDLLTVLFRRENEKNEYMPLWSIYDATGSLNLALLEWKKRLADYLSSRGAFLLLDWETWLSKERSRLQWMLSQEHSQSLHILNDTTFDICGWRQSSQVHRMVAVLSWTMYHLVASECGPSVRGDRYKTLDDRELYFRFLASQRSRSQEQAAIDACNEFIIILDSCSTLDEILKCLDCNQKAWTDHQTTVPLKYPGRCEYRPAQPRRDVADGLLAASDDDKEEEAELISCVAGILFKTLNDRISMTSSEMVGNLLDHPVCAALDPSEVGAYFSVGINVLKVQGLIRERKFPGKNEAIFEKAAVVFCSGA